MTLLAGLNAGTTSVVPIAAVAAWVEPYREVRERFRALYPALRALR